MIKKFDSEENLHQQVVDYLKLQYPGILFRTDFAAGIKMTLGQAVKHKKLQAGRAWPDIFVAAPMYKEQVVDWYGLFIELKKEGTKLKAKNGRWASPHIAEQAEVLTYLRFNGYCATFACGFEAAKDVIDKYLAGYREALTAMHGTPQQYGEEVEVYNSENQAKADDEKEPF